MKFVAAALMGLVSSQQLYNDLPESFILDDSNMPNMTPNYGYQMLDLQNLNSCGSSANSLIKDGEGLRTKMYYDTMGIPTVCYGYNLRNGNARSAVKKAGGDYDSIMNGQATSQKVCDNLLKKEVDVAKSAAKSIFGSLKCSAAQDVAIDMTYNLGSGGMRGFPNFIKAMKAGNWQTAAAEGKNSLWCSQVGRRCSRNMNQITSCCK